MNSYKHILVITIIVALTVFAFLPSLENSFVNDWDDNVHLLHNSRVRSLDTENIKGMFSQMVEGTYIPLTVLSYAVEYHFSEYEPFTYHLTNLILHVAVTGLVYWLALSLQLPLLAAGMAALIFGLHPIHVESVAWVTERKDLLYSAFYLLSVILYLRYLKKGSLPAYLLSIMFGLLSILSKSMALSLPLILWTIDWLQRREIKWSILFDKAMYFLVLVPVAWITYASNANIMAPSQNIVQAGTIYIWSFCHYIWKFFYPVGFSPVHEMSEPIALTNSAYFFPLVAFVVITALLVRFRRNRLFVFAVAYYFASIFFILRGSVVVFGAQMVSDRFMYLPCLGFCLWVGYCLHKIYLRIGEKEWIKRFAFIVFIAGLSFWLGVTSFRQCKVWENGGTLWAHSLKHFPKSAVANNNMADFMLKKGIINRDVVAYCRQAVESYPFYADAYVNLGSVLAQLGQVVEATGHFQKALSLKPEHSTAHANLATALMQQGRRKEAAVHAQKAIKLGFHSPDLERMAKFKDREVFR